MQTLILLKLMIFGKKYFEFFCFGARIFPTIGNLVLA